MDEIRPVILKGDRVVMLDQRLLPLEEVYNEYKSSDEVAGSITDMVIRGAPAMATTEAPVIKGFLIEDATVTEVPVQITGV